HSRATRFVGHGKDLRELGQVVLAKAARRRPSAAQDSIMSSDRPDDPAVGPKPPALPPERKSARLLREQATRPAEGIHAAGPRTRVGVERPPTAVPPTDLQPLLLLPLRLEYRLVTRAVPPPVVDFSSELETFKAIDARHVSEARQRERRAAASALLGKAPTV